MSIRHMVLARSLVLLIKTVDEKVSIFSGGKGLTSRDKEKGSRSSLRNDYVYSRPDAYA